MYIIKYKRLSTMDEDHMDLPSDALGGKKKSSQTCRFHRFRSKNWSLGMIGMFLLFAHDSVESRFSHVTSYSPVLPQARTVVHHPPPLPTAVKILNVSRLKPLQLLIERGRGL